MLDGLDAALGPRRPGGPSEAGRCCLRPARPAPVPPGSALDSYNDAEVRQALEPLAAVAERLTAAFLGVAHVNKTSGTDPLNAIMGSRAFGSVARSVLFAMRAPDYEQSRGYLLGQPKNNWAAMTCRPSPTASAPSMSAPTRKASTSGRPTWNGRARPTSTSVTRSGWRARAATVARRAPTPWPG